MSKMLKVTEVAAELEVSPSTLRRLEKRVGVIPERTPGGHRRYTDAHVKRLKSYLESRFHQFGQMESLPNIILD